MNERDLEQVALELTEKALSRPHLARIAPMVGAVLAEIHRIDPDAERRAGTPRQLHFTWRGFFFKAKGKHPSGDEDPACIEIWETDSKGHKLITPVTRIYTLREAKQLDLSEILYSHVKSRVRRFPRLAVGVQR